MMEATNNIAKPIDEKSRKPFREVVFIVIFITIVTALILLVLSSNSKKVNPITTLLNSILPKTQQPKPAGLSAIDFPPITASDEEKRYFLSDIEAKSQRSTNITIKNCSPTPSVAYVLISEKLTLINDDDVDHTISVNQNHSYKIPAKKKIVISPDFGKGLGVYGYNCDRLSSLAGIFFVRSR